MYCRRNIIHVVASISGHTDGFQLLVVTWCFARFSLKDGVSDGGKHKDKVIASQLVNLKLFATIVPSQSQIEVRLQPSSSKVLFATLHLTLSCVFLRQGKATYVVSVTNSNLYMD